MQTIRQASRVLLDNDRVNVSEVVQEPHTAVSMHSHPAYLIYARTAGEVKFTHPDGGTEIVRYEPGQVIFREAESHSTENIGESTVDILVVDLKQS